MFFRCEAETARSDEIESARIADDLPDHAGKVATSEPLLQREQGVFGTRRLDMDEPVAQFTRKTLRVRTSTALDCAGVLNP